MRFTTKTAVANTPGTLMEKNSVPSLSNNDIEMTGGRITDQNMDGNIALNGTTAQPGSIATDGVYIVRGFMYTGDTRDQAWYMDMMCEARGAADLLSSSAQQRIYS